MTNFEKYKDEILEITNKGNDIASIEGKIIECKVDGCENCDFNSERRYGISCNARMLSWLYEEAKPTLTPEERVFCEVVSKGCITRNDAKDLCYWHGGRKPEKYINHNEWRGRAGVYCIGLKDDLFPFVTWEDEEPWNVEDLLKLEVCDDKR